jgi:uncharacterized protein involved in exopolysaccharide biosynthesis
MSQPTETPVAGRPPLHYSVGINYLLGVVWQRKRLLLLCVLISVALGAVYLARIEPTYEVRAQLLLEKQGFPASELAEQRTNRDLEFLATQAEILKSPVVVGPAAELLHWPATPGQSSSKAMRDCLAVRPIAGTHVVSLTLQARDARLATAGAQAIIDSYEQYLQASEHDTYLETLELLTRNEKEIRADLQVMDEQYRQLRERSPLSGNGQSGVDVHMALVEEVGRQLAQVRQQRIQLENQLLLVERGKNKDEQLTAVPSTLGGAFFGYVTSLPQSKHSDATTAPPTLGRLAELSADPMANSPAATALQQQLVEAQLREKGLATRYGPKHPDVRAVRNQISELSEAHRSAIAAGPELLRRQLDSATADEQRLSELYRTELDAAKTIDVFLLEEQQLTDQISRVQTLHASILDQMRQSKLWDAAATDGSSRVNVTLLQEPEIPLTPVWPNPKIVFGFCGMIGLLVAAGLITFAECQPSTDAISQRRHPAVRSLSPDDEPLADGIVLHAR